MTDIVRFRISLVGLVGSLVATFGASIIFIFTTFATKADVEDKTKDLAGHLVEVKQEVREVRVEVNKKLDTLIKQHLR